MGVVISVSRLPFFVFMSNMQTSIKTEYSLKYFWPRLWSLLAPSQKQIKILFGLIMILELSKFIWPFILKNIIDLITNFQPGDAKKLVYLLIAAFAANQAVSIIAYFFDRKIFQIIAEVERYLPVEAHRKMMLMGLSYHEKENTGNKISKIIRGVDKVVNLLGNFFWEVAPTCVQIVFTATVLFIVDWRFGLIFCFFAPLFALATLKLNRDLFPHRRLRHHKYDESSGLMAQSIININTVKSFVQEKRETADFASIRGKIRDIFTFEFLKQLKFNLGRNFIIDSGRIFMLLFGVFLVTKQQITVGTLVFVFTISEKALFSLYRVSRLYDRIMESSEPVDGLSELKDASPEIVNTGRLKPDKITGAIEFRGVNYTYDENKVKALDDVNLKINSDCVTALVGPSGGGKTTLARMIYRHYDPQRGCVMLDDNDLKEYDLHTFRRFISIVPQEVEIFNASVRDNIAYAKPQATRDEVEAAARIANADEFINYLPKKFETLVGERGVRLSGGQRQRVGIARAILANPRILIFDEATSNLDSYSEKLIQEAIEKVRKGRTMIIIAHRLSTIKRADKIVVLEDGRVVEQGSHFELSQNSGGLYAKLLNLQQLGDVV